MPTGDAQGHALIELLERRAARGGIHGADEFVSSFRFLVEQGSGPRGIEAERFQESVVIIGEVIFGLRKIRHENAEAVGQRNVVVLVLLDGLKLALTKYGFDGLIAGIRRDEEATRAKERVFSPRGTEGGWDVRDQPPEFWDQFNASPPPGAHLRVHPILHWTEADIWAYTQRENIPIIPLYLANNGKRYRSLGDQDITNPVASTASTIEEILIELDGTKVPERAGRALDHETEDAFERLRVAGYL